MTKLFKHPVFIKPWGVIVSPEQIGPMIGFFHTEAAEYEMVLSDNPMVDTTVGVRLMRTHTFGADVILASEVLDFNAGAEHFNDAMFNRAASIFNSPIGVSDEDAVEEEEAPKRGRRRKETEEEREEREEREAEEAQLAEEAEEARIESNIGEKAISFNLYEIRNEGPVTDFMSSKPVSHKIEKAKRDDMQDAISHMLAKLQKMADERNKILATIRNPDADSVGMGMGSIIPNLDDESVSAIDEVALKRYENAQRVKLDEIEKNIRTAYDKLKTSIIDPFNAELEKLSRSKQFSTTGMVIADEEITIKTLLDLLTTEAMIEIPVNEKTGVVVPALLSTVETD